MTDQDTEVTQANGTYSKLFPRPTEPTDTPTPAPAAPAADEDEQRPAPIPVDPDPRDDPHTLPWQRQHKPHPIVPEWVADAAQRKAAALWAWRWTKHATLFHLVRTPKYGVRAGYYAPRGGIRALVKWVRWLLDWDAASLRLDLIQNRDAAAYHRAARHRDDRVKNRAIGSLAALAAAGIGGAVAYLEWPLVFAAAAAGAAGALVWHGRPIDKPFLVDRTILPTAVSRLTSDVVARALAALGNDKLKKAVEKHELAFTAPIVRDGDGWRAEIDLPHGIAAVDVIEKRVALSSGLRRPLGCVWPEPLEDEHTGHLVLWVGDRTLRQQPTRPFPLLENGRASLFEPLPFGVDQRGRAVTVTLLFAAMAVGAQPRMGKTFAVRLLALAAALDPTCELHIYDGKGMGDWVMFEQVAHTYLSGSRTDTLLALRDALLELKAEVERRAELLEKLTRAGRSRESKVTPELAADKSLGLHPIVIVLDECQLCFDTGSGAAGKIGDEITELTEYIVRVGPAAGVSSIPATQRPDGKSLPTGIRANVQYRFCLRVADQPTNDMVLGTSAYKNGVRSTEFGLRDKGIGYLAGEGDEAMIVRTYYVDADQATGIIARARQLREQAGTLSGMAAGIEPKRRSDPGELLLDVLAAMGGEDKMWSSAIAEQLASTQPGRYAGWDQTALGKALRAQGVTPGQTWWTPPTGAADNRTGVTRAQINEALKALRGKNQPTGS